MSAITRDAMNLRQELHDLLDALPVESMADLAERLVGARRVYTAGMGRSGLVARAFAMRLMHLGVTAYVVGDTTTPAIGEGDALVIVSGSGGVAGMVVVAEKAKRHGAAIAVVTEHADAPLVHIADTAVVLPPPVPGRSVQPMGSRFEQGALLTLDLLVIDLMRRLGQDEAAMAARHANLE